MSACELCWTEASRRALLGHGTTAELYPIVLAENDGNPDHIKPLTEGGDR